MSFYNVYEEKYFIKSDINKKKTGLAVYGLERGLF
jgi:hypothetical protein